MTRQTQIALTLASYIAVSGVVTTIMLLIYSQLYIEKNSNYTNTNTPVIIPTSNNYDERKKACDASGGKYTLSWSNLDDAYYERCRTVEKDLWEDNK